MTAMTIAARCRILVATALLGTGASGFAVLPAVAASLDPPQLTVKYGDLNVDTPTGAGVLYIRIQSAAKSVCSQFGGRGLDAYARREACINKAILGAVAKVNLPAVSAAYRARQGKEPTFLVASSRPPALR